MDTMSSSAKLRDHAAKMIAAAPHTAVVALILSILSIAVLQPPVPYMITAAITGLVWGFLLPYYWRSGSAVSAGILILLVILPEQILRRKLLVDPTHDILLTMLSLLPYISICLFVGCAFLGIRKQAILRMTEAEPRRPAEPSSAGAPEGR